MMLHEAILAALITLSPPEKLPQFPGHEESPAAALIRYGSIAEDVAFVVTEDCAGQATDADKKRCQRRDTAELLGTARHETDFARDTDHDGRCFVGHWRGWDYKRRCDGNNSVSMWQMQNGTALEKASWRASRREAARAALKMIHQSRRFCRKHGNEGAYAAYADGDCESYMGLMRSRELWGSVWKAEKVLPSW